MIGCFENMSPRVRCFLGLGAGCVMPFSPVTPCHLSRCPRSSLNSVNSSDSRSSGSHGSHSHSPSSHYRYRGSSLAQQAPVRLSSVSFHECMRKARRSWRAAGKAGLRLRPSRLHPPGQGRWGLLT